MIINRIKFLPNLFNSNRILQNKFKCATITSIAPGALSQDVFEKEPINMPYDLEKISLFRNQLQKDLYIKLSEGVDEPEYTSYNWEHSEDDETVRCYDFFDKNNVKRKSAEIASDGFPKSVTLYDENECKMTQVNANFKTDGYIKIVKTLYDTEGNELSSQKIQLAL